MRDGSASRVHDIAEPLGFSVCSPERGTGQEQQVGDIRIATNKTLIVEEAEIILKLFKGIEHLAHEERVAAKTTR